MKLTGRLTTDDMKDHYLVLQVNVIKNRIGKSDVECFLCLTKEDIAGSAMLTDIQTILAQL